MADENLQEPSAEERAKFEEDVLKAAEEAMKVEAAAQQSEADKKPADEANAEQPAEPAAEDSTPESTETQEDILKAELASANAKADEANDRYMRLMAEFDNFRRRSAKEQLDLIEVANGKLLEKFADVWENFDRAFAAENKGDLANFEKGMQMIQTQFVKVLTDAGLEQIDPTGAEFDPNCHEALMQQPSETVPEGNVVTVFQKGYKLKNKILKTAKVIVSSGK
ncbi:nucleotide exchange factor GrpE [Fibrobacter sp.]|uniref:nucleotide exchange factor GrpE n=1 Tax=Fibrobacter sp. TaxID=35828 RepID=UPI003890C8C5